ncbi:MAG: hypothetical protein K1Y02_09835 [Candidatus Hydrogenedentes bacterium]|nr:hypothetical protein [Candidatus Hydrogenedentota bacterium]
MSRRGSSSSKGVLFPILLAVVFIGAAAIVGFWIGSLGGSDFSTSDMQSWTPDEPVSAPEEETAATPRMGWPLFFSTSVLPGSDIEAVIGEVRLAALAGVHQYAVRVPLPWPGVDTPLEPVTAALDRILETDPEATLFLWINFEPPAAWLDAHPDAASSIEVDGKRLVSLESQVWTEAGKSALAVLAETVNKAKSGDHIKGVIVAGPVDGAWLHAGDYDRSPSGTSGFRAWLRTQYADNMALQTAWGDLACTFDDAPIPDKPNSADTLNVFFKLPEEQRQVDYLRYLSESTADAVSEFAGFLRQNAKTSLLILATYGSAFEYPANDSGQLALGILLDGVVDGVVTPVSYKDRGLGGAGGFMGPVDSARWRKKLWALVDDTRTGISRNAVSGEIERIEGLRSEDVLRVQRRNFAAAVTHGLGVMWDDAQGVGSLHNTEMWDLFRRMRESYQAVWPTSEAWTKGEPIAYATPEQRLTLCVVVDEASRFFQRCDTKLNELLLAGVRDAALRSGVPTQFCLLQDILSGHAQEAAVYLFVNAFHLHPEDRDQIKNLLIAQRSAAIWMYAPGYIDDQPSVENCAATTGLKVLMFDGPARSGSQWQLSGGRFVGQGTAFGGPDQWAPMFYIETEETKIMARYRESGMVSVAAEFFPEGWASIYVAEPVLTPEILREILLILEKHVFIRQGGEKHSDILHFGPNMVAVHAGSNGERSLDLGATFNIQDRLDPDVGWQNKRFLLMPMKQGDTRVLGLEYSKETEQLPQGAVENAESTDSTQAPAEPVEPPPPESVSSEPVGTQYP